MMNSMNPAPPPDRTRTVLAWVGIVVCAVGVLITTLSPTPVDKGHGGTIEKVLKWLYGLGLPRWFGYEQVEFTANIVMFVPLGFFVGLLLPAGMIWLGLVIVPAVSGAIEFAQSQFLSERFATVLDVLANTLGGWSGLVVAVGVRALVRARDETIIARALWRASGGNAHHDERDGYSKRS